MDSCLNTSIAHLHALAPQPCDAIPSPPSSPASRLHPSRSISPEWIERKGMEERAQCKQSIREGNLFRSTTSANRWPMQLHTNRRNSPSVPDTITKRNTPQQTTDIAVPRRRVGQNPEETPLRHTFRPKFRRPMDRHVPEQHRKRQRPHGGEH